MDLLRVDGYIAIDEIAEGKAQLVRLLDVVALGPLMVWVGTARQVPPWARSALVLAGFGTILYNWRNYQSVRRVLET